MILCVYMIPAERHTREYKRYTLTKKKMKDESVALLKSGDHKSCDEGLIPDSQDDKKNDSHVNKNKLLGYVAFFAGLVMAGVGLSSVQLLAQSVPHSELNGLRYIGQIIVLSPFLFYFHKCDVRIKRQNIIHVVICSIVNIAYSYCSYGTAYYLPVGLGVALMDSLPVVINITIGIIIMKQVKWYEILAAAVCLVGVMLVIQPEAIFGESASDMDTDGLALSPCFSVDTNNTNTTGDIITTKQETTGYILGVATAVASVITMYVMSGPLNEEDIFKINFWTAFLAIPVSFCIMAIMETPTLPSKAVCQLFVIIHMVCAGSVTILFNKAYQFLSPQIAAILATLGIPEMSIVQFAGVPGLLVGHRNALGIFGAVLIILANIVSPAIDLLNCKPSKRLLN